jgi:Skp family chaperone for outer membrane proteins
MRRYAVVVIACFLGVLSALPLVAQSQQVTRVGVINFRKVLDSIYQDTKAYRDYEKANSDYSKELATRNKTILDLQAQRADADKSSNKTLSASLDKQISDQLKDLDAFKKVKGAQLAQMKDAASTTQAILQIMDVVSFISESEGYSLVLRSDGDAGTAVVLYRIPEIDITDDVITELQKRNAPASTTGG